MRAEAEPWVERAEQDIAASELLLDRGLLRGAIFHSHEAIEKLLKAIWIDRRGEQAEKTHNLRYLARGIGLELSDEQEEFLRKLYWELIPSRYPEGDEPDLETAQWYHRHAREMFEWLRRHLT